MFANNYSKKAFKRLINENTKIIHNNLSVYFDILVPIAAIYFPYFDFKVL